MRARFNFASALFSKASMDRLAGYYLAVLQQMAHHDDWPLENIRLQPQSQALPASPAFGYAFERSLQQDFVQHARRNPQAVAVVDEQGEMTYGELHAAALTLATSCACKGG